MQGAWGLLEVSGRSLDAFIPSTPSGFAVIYLHDADEGSLRDWAESAAMLDTLGLACLCPRAGGCWWTDRPCADLAGDTAERVIMEGLVPEIRRRWTLWERGLAVAGMGMGGQGALRLAFRHPQQFTVVAALAPALEYEQLYGQGGALDDMYDSKEQCRQDTAIMHVPPSSYPAHIFFCCDPADRLWYRGNDRLHEKLNALGIPHEADLKTRAGGHSKAYFEHMAPRAFAFVKEALARESRRLL